MRENPNDPAPKDLPLPDIPTLVHRCLKAEEDRNLLDNSELRMGSRRSCISQVRLQTAYQLVQDYGIPLAEVARHLGVSMSAISKAITRRTKE